MPWLSDEIPDWEELTEEERDVLREMVRALGMEMPGCPDVDDDYFE
jgi:hypothetical protein